MAEQKMTTEEAFRESLKDVAAIMESLTPVCSDVKDMAEMIRLAVQNDGQLKLIMKIVIPQNKR